MGRKWRSAVALTLALGLTVPEVCAVPQALEGKDYLNSNGQVKGDSIPVFGVGGNVNIIGSIPLHVLVEKLPVDIFHEGSTDKGINVWVTNKPEGTLIMNRFVSLNNALKCDYKLKEFEYDTKNTDIAEVLGKKGNFNDYDDTDNSIVNDLIEKGVYQRDVIIVSKKIPQDGEIKRDIQMSTQSVKMKHGRSDLIMGLVKAYEGVQTEGEEIFELKQKKYGEIPCEEYEHRDLIKQDTITNKITIKRNLVKYCYSNPNNKLRYLDRAVKMGVLGKAQIDKSYVPTVHTQDLYKTSSDDALYEENIDLYTALHDVAKIVRKKEGFTSEQDIKKLNYLYGAEIDRSVPQKYLTDVKYLIAKGILFPNDNIRGNELDNEFFFKILYRVKNKEQRFHIDNINLTENDKKLMDNDIRKNKIEIYPDMKGIEDIMPTPNVKDTINRGIAPETVETNALYISGFFNSKVLAYMKSLGLGNNQRDKQKYANRFYLTTQSYYNKNLFCRRGKNFDIRVYGNDLRVSVDKNTLAEVQALASECGEKVELNSANGKDVPEKLAFDTVNGNGRYSLSGEGLHREGGYWISGLHDGPKKNTATTDDGEEVVLNTFVVKQRIYLADNKGLDCVNYISHGKILQLDTALKDNKAPHEKYKDGDFIKVSVGNGVNCYEIKFKVKANRADIATKILHSRLSMNYKKYSGMSAIDGYSSTNGQTTYVGKNFLEFFGNVTVIRDKVLYNRDTNTYGLLLEGSAVGSGNAAGFSRNELKTVVIGSTIKRYPLKSPSIVFREGGTTYYRLDAIQDLLAGSTFRRMIDKDNSNKYFGLDSKDEKMVSLYTDAKDSTFIQKDYVVDYNKEKYLNMANANYANDYAIIDMFNLMCSLNKDLEVSLEDKYSSEQHLRMIVKWAWFLPKGAIGKKVPKDQIEYADYYYTPPSDSENLAYYNANMQITNNILGRAMGTENIANCKYATSGYLVPQFTLLTTKKTSTVEVDNVKRILYKYVIGPIVTQAGSPFKVSGNEIERFDQFTNYMNTKYTDIGSGKGNDGAMIFFRALGPKSISKENIYSYGDYLQDAKGTVYQKVGNSKGGNFSVGNGLFYVNKGRSDRIFVNPWSHPSNINFKVGGVYGYSNDSKSHYVYLGTGKNNENKMCMRFMKRPEESKTFANLGIFDQLSDMNTPSIQASIYSEMRKNMKVYAKEDVLYSENAEELKGDDDLTVVKNKDGSEYIKYNNFDYTLFVPSTSDLNSLGRRGYDTARIMRVDKGNYWSKIAGNGILMSDPNYMRRYKKGWNWESGSGRSKQTGQIPFPKNKKGSTPPTNVFAPVIRILPNEYKVMNIRNGISSGGGNVTTDGTIVKYSKNSKFNLLAEKYPNFNLAEQWSKALMDKSDTSEARRYTIGEIQEESYLTLNNSDRFLIKSGGIITYKDGSPIKPAETINITLTDGEKVKSLSRYLSTEDGITRLHGGLFVTKSRVTSEDNKSCYILDVNQNPIPGFNQIVPFNLDLDASLGDSYRFSYSGYDDEVPSNLTKYVKDLLEFYKTQAGKSKMYTIALLVIQLISLLIVFLWFDFAMCCFAGTKSFFVKLRDDLHMDVLKIMTLGMGGVDNETTFGRLSLGTIVLMLVQGIILVWYIGMPTSVM